MVALVRTWLAVESNNLLTWPRTAPQPCGLHRNRVGSLYQHGHVGVNHVCAFGYRQRLDGRAEAGWRFDNRLALGQNPLWSVILEAAGRPAPSS